MDEAGRGPLAGPLVAAAVILAPGFDPAREFPNLQLRDSKQMTYLQREQAFTLIKAKAQFYHVTQIEVAEINAYGIGWANRAIFERMIAAIDADFFIVDGNLKLDVPVTRWGRVESRIRADESVAAVSAASVLAKVTRDRLMETLHERYPAYGWDRNKGYGTPGHIKALREIGPCPQHRVQFCQTALSKAAPPPRPAEGGAANRRKKPRR
jgi:ribonuclease HII